MISKQKTYKRLINYVLHVLDANTYVDVPQTLINAANFSKHSHIQAILNISYSNIPDQH